MQQPGFYPDPLDPSQLRYWDGATWSDMVKAEQAVSARSIEDPAGDPGFASIAPQHSTAADAYQGANAAIASAGDAQDKFKAVLIGIVLTAMAVGACFLAFKDIAAFSSGATPVLARTTSVQVEPAADSDTRRADRECYVRYEYTIDETTHTGVGPSSKKWCRYQLGDTVRIEYANASPGASRVLDGESAFTLPVLAALFVAGTIAWWWWMVPRWPRRHDRT